MENLLKQHGVSFEVLRHQPVFTSGLLYEQMSRDGRYREFAARHRDWLLGRNPWGTLNSWAFKGSKSGVPFECKTSSLTSVNGVVPVPTGPGLGVV